MSKYFQFKSLSPQSINNDKKHGRCFEKLDFALGFHKDKHKHSSARIKNIAITGGYGSGKSTLINSYINYRTTQDKNFSKKILLVSLATFNLNTDSNHDQTENAKLHDRQDVELSILQQLIYHERASKLPLSRFRRIQNLTKSERAWLFLKFASCLLFFVIAYMSFFVFPDIPVFSNFKPYNKIIGTLLIALGSSFFLFPILKGFYTGNYSIDKVNLTKAEISLSDNAEKKNDRSESLLNIYLDEIVYFFDETNYQYIVFEDLDRTEHVEIFVKLREINQILNSTRSKNNPIKFIYAVRDGLFNSPEDRTKFFDYIVPIIPILDFSNSYELLEEELKRYPNLFTNESSEDNSLTTSIIDKNFLQEVSLYINDMRVMTNIVNEFYIYLEKETLEENNKKSIDRNDAQKVLALMIYKNLMPLDFSKIKDRTSSLYRIIDDYNHGAIFDAFVKPKYHTSLKELQAQKLKIIEEKTSNENELINELVKKYVLGGKALEDNLYYGEHSEGDYRSNHDYFNEEWLAKNKVINIFSDMINPEMLKLPLYVATPYRHNQYYTYITSLQSTITTDFRNEIKKEYSTRLSIIKAKTNDKLTKLNENIRQIEQKLNPDNYSLSEILETADGKWQMKYLPQSKETINSLQSKLSTIIKEQLDEDESSKLNNILETYKKEASSLVGQEDPSVLIFLLRNGYIDNSYPFYISYLYNNPPTIIEYRKVLANRESYEKSARIKLSKADIPNLIDRLNLNKVYKQEAILNLDLIHFLVSHSSHFKYKTLLGNTIKHHFHTDSSFHAKFLYDFINRYSNDEKSKEPVESLIKQIFSDKSDPLSSYYDNRNPNANYSEHEYLIKQILAQTPADILCDSAALEEFIKDILSLSDIINQFEKFTDTQIKNILNNINEINCKLPELSKPTSNKATSVFKGIVQNKCYALTLENIKIIANQSPNELNNVNRLLETSHLATLLSLNNEPLQEYVFDDINYYVEKIYLELEENNDDDPKLIIKEFLNNEDLSFELKTEILKKGNIIIKDISLLINAKPNISDEDVLEEGESREEDKDE